eukprot:TRINITY_DN1763_c0_g1_i7.p1 TRINITY_DN1763_c0_g1~~TRINITY_DN1763_c0_g1_i7.p1  ORF type:complete len:125 (-),score=24.95 TRINITY_DN1763_c0_g1_i7:442-816(-)
MLEKNSSLLRLNLRSNRNVGNAGLVRIAEALEINTSLKTLDLSDCEIGSITAIRIAEMLEKNSSLLNLDLSYNIRMGMRQEGVVLIAEALEGNTSLKTLKLSNCGIGQDISIRISELLERNSSL